MLQKNSARFMESSNMDGAINRKDTWSIFSQCFRFIFRLYDILVFEIFSNEAYFKNPGKHNQEVSKQKVMLYLYGFSEDPKQVRISKAIADRIAGNSPAGKVIMLLLQKAENGEFK